MIVNKKKLISIHLNENGGANKASRLITEQLKNDSRVSLKEQFLEYSGDYTFFSTVRIFMSKISVISSFFLEYKSEISSVYTSSYLVAFLSVIFNKKTIFHFHGFELGEKKDFVLNANNKFTRIYLGFFYSLNVFILKYVCVKAYAILVPVSSSLQFLEQKTGLLLKQKSLVVLNGLSSSEYKSSANLFGAKKKVAFIGRIDEQKGIDHMLSVFEKWSSFSLDIFAPSVGTTYEKLIVKKVLSMPNVSIYFDKEPSEIHKKISLCTATMLLSESEQLPLALIESVASSIPMIVSNSFKASKIIKAVSKNLIIKSQNVVEIRSIICNVYYMDEKSKKLLCSRMNRLSKYFSWDKSVEAIIANL